MIIISEAKERMSKRIISFQNRKKNYRKARKGLQWENIRGEKWKTGLWGGFRGWRFSGNRWFITIYHGEQMTCTCKTKILSPSYFFDPLLTLYIFFPETKFFYVTFFFPSSDSWSISVFNDHSSNGCRRKGIPFTLSDRWSPFVTFLLIKKGFPKAFFFEGSLHTWHLSTPNKIFLNFVSLLCRKFCSLVFQQALS